jgi:hypothetical protein
MDGSKLSVARIGLLLVPFILSADSAVHADVILNQDSTVNYQIAGEQLQIVDGPAPPTHVTILEPAEIEQSVLVFGSSIVQMNGGTVGGFITDGTSSVNITGGTIQNEIDAQGSSTVTIAGGNIFGDLNPENSSTIFIVGSGFNFPYGPVSTSSGSLMGTLASGHLLDVFFNIDGEAHLVLVPEASTLALLACGAVVFLAVTKRRFTPR